MRQYLRASFTDPWRRLISEAAGNPGFIAVQNESGMRRAGRFLALFAFFLTVLYALFQPALTLPFMIHDEYRFFQPLAGLDRPHCCAAEVVAEHYRIDGRFVAGEIMRLFHHLPVTTLADLQPIRLALVAILSLVATILAAFLIRHNVNPWAAVPASFAAVTVPGFQIGVTWVTTAPTIVAAVPAVIAGTLMFGWPRIAFDVHGKRRLACIFLLVYISLQTYPATTPIFFAPFVALVLFGRATEWPALRYRFAVAVIGYCAIYLAYFLAHKFVILPFLQKAGALPLPNAARLSFAVADDLWPNIKRFLEFVTPAALNIWHIEINRTVAGAVLGVISIGAAAGYLNWRRGGGAAQGGSPTLMQQIICVGIVAGFANVQNILPQGGFIQHRTMAVYQLIIVLILMWSLWSMERALVPAAGHRRGFVVGALIVAIGGFLLAQQSIANNVRNAHLEYRYIRARIVEHLRLHGDLRNLHVSTIAPSGAKPDTLNYYDLKIIPGTTILNYPEFNYSSFREEWPAYVVAIAGEATGRRDLAFVCDSNHQPDRCTSGTIVVSYDGRVGNSPLSQANRNQPGALIVDMHDLLQGRDGLESIAKGNLARQLAANPDPSAEPILIADGYRKRGYNIVQFRGHFYGIAQADGPFDAVKADGNAYPHKVFRSTSLAELQSVLDQQSADTSSIKKSIP